MMTATRCHGAAMIEVEPGAYGRCPGCPDCAHRTPQGRPSVRDPQAGAVARDVGVSRAGDHSPAVWVSAARAAVRRLCDAGRPFTTDDVWEALRGATPPEPRAMGAVMTWARTSGLCDPTDRVVPSDRPESHRRPVRVWAPAVRP